MRFESILKKLKVNKKKKSCRSEELIRDYSNAILKKHKSGNKVRLVFFLEISSFKDALQPYSIDGITLERIENDTSLYVGKTQPFILSSIFLRNVLKDIFSYINDFEGIQLIGIYANEY